jgi:hypothetical protein
VYNKLALSMSVFYKSNFLRRELIFNCLKYPGLQWGNVFENDFYVIHQVLVSPHNTQNSAISFWIQMSLCNYSKTKTNKYYKQQLWHVLFSSLLLHINGRFTDHSLLSCSTWQWCHKEYLIHRITNSPSKQTKDRS